MGRIPRPWRDGGAGSGVPEPELTARDVKSRAASGVVLLLGRGLAFRVLGLLGNLVIARLLDPADFGLIAIGLTVVNVGQILADCGIGVQMIARAEPPTHRELRAIMGMQLIITSTIAASSAGVAVVVGGGGLATAVMMLALPLTAIRWPATLLFSRRMEFLRTVRIEVAEVLSYLISSVGLALLGLGVWSLVLANLIRSGSGALVAIRISPAKLVLPSWDPPTMRSMLSFGARLQATTIIHMAHDVILTAGIGAIGGLEVVGLWSFASRQIGPGPRAPMHLPRAKQDDPLVLADDPDRLAQDATQNREDDDQSNEIDDQRDHDDVPFRVAAPSAADSTSSTSPCRAITRIGWPGSRRPPAQPRRPELAANLHDALRVQPAAAHPACADQLIQAEEGRQVVDPSGDTGQQQTDDQASDGRSDQHPRRHRDVGLHRQQASPGAEYSSTEPAIRHTTPASTSAPWVAALSSSAMSPTARPAPPRRASSWAAWRTRPKPAPGTPDPSHRAAGRRGGPAR